MYPSLCACIHACMHVFGSAYVYVCIYSDADQMQNMPVCQVSHWRSLGGSPSGQACMKKIPSVQLEPKPNDLCPNRAHFLANCYVGDICMKNVADSLLSHQTFWTTVAYTPRNSWLLTLGFIVPPAGLFHTTISNIMELRSFWKAAMPTDHRILNTVGSRN